jgi:CheY-like chemotaxis protein
VIKPTELQQIVVNLLINARDSISHKGRCNIRLYESRITHPKLCQSCHQQYRGQYLVIEVQDNGSGIPDETKRHIFDAFYSTKSGDKGTGLGLFNVHGITHTRAGHLDVESRVGEGSCFRVFLPAAKKAKNKRTAAVRAKIVNRNSSARLRIMIVDDEASSAGFLQEWLRGLEFEVTAFTDSLAAHKHLIIENHPYDLVIADYRMPGIQGMELLSDYLSVHKHKTAILLGAQADRSVLAGCTLNIHFVEKPLNTANLKILLDDIIHL